MKIISLFYIIVALLTIVSEAHHHMNFRRIVEKYAVKTSISNDQFSYFDQRNNHFLPEDTSTYKQRYYVNSTLWGGNGFPIFVYLGGESPMTPYDLAGYYTINEMATEYKGLMVSVEHRFYGESIPGDGTLSVKNLKLLSSEQAIADYAVFIDFIKSEYKAPDSKVVAIGGSYSGNLAAWLRQKYPNVVDIAYATSAPVQAQLDFPEYYQVMMEDLGQTCGDGFRTALDKVDELLKTNITKIETDFKVCSKMENEQDIEIFLGTLASVPAVIVQYSGLVSWNIQTMCSVFDTVDAYDGLVKLIRAYYGDSCISVNYTQSLELINMTDPNGPAASERAWYYQTCVEFGYFTTPSPGVPFDKNTTVDSYLETCQEIFGIDKSKPGVCVNNTNKYYGGRNVKSDNIIFLNGSVDPWHALGIIKDTPTPEKMPVFYIQGTAHCADLMSSKPTDPPALVEARTKAWKYLSRWLGKDDSSSSSPSPASSSNPASSSKPTPTSSSGSKTRSESKADSKSSGFVPFIHTFVLSMLLVLTVFIPRM